MSFAWLKRYQLYEKETKFSLLLKKCFAELIGTCFLVFFGTAVAASIFHSLAVVHHAHFEDATDTFLTAQGEPLSPRYYINEPINIIFIALGFSVALFIAICFAANVSGAHINPAMTVAFVLSQRTSVLTGVLYVICQLIGATFGCWFIAVVNEPGYMAASGAVNAVNRTAEIGKMSIFVMETAVLFFLALTVLVLTIRRKSPTASQYLLPLAASAIIFLGHLVCIPLDGFAGNPARAFAPALVAHYWEHHWIFWGGPIFGAVLASIVYLTTFSSLNEYDVDVEEGPQAVLPTTMQEAQATVATTSKRGDFPNDPNLTTSVTIEQPQLPPQPPLQPQPPPQPTSQGQPSGSSYPVTVPMDKLAIERIARETPLSPRSPSPEGKAPYLKVNMGGLPAGDQNNSPSNPELQPDSKEVQEATHELRDLYSQLQHLTKGLEEGLRGGSGIPPSSLPRATSASIKPANGFPSSDSTSSSSIARAEKFGSTQTTRPAQPVKTVAIGSSHPGPSLSSAVERLQRVPCIGSAGGLQAEAPQAGQFRKAFFTPVTVNNQLLWRMVVENDGNYNEYVENATMARLVPSSSSNRPPASDSVPSSSGANVNTIRALRRSQQTVANGLL